MRTFIGIDPGQSGAIAFLYNRGGVSSDRVFDCPLTAFEAVALVERNTAGELFAVIEKVHAFYKSSAKSAFCFGENFGMWQGVIASMGISYDFVTPAKWQKEVFDSAKKLKTTKLQSFERATRLFPGAELKTARGKVLDGRCDALLIAEYCRRLHY